MPGLDPLELGLRNVVAPEESGAERANAVAADEVVDVADVIRLEDDGECRRARVEPSPDLVRVIRRGERVEDGDLSTRLDARRGHRLRPVEPRIPVRMLDAPEPKTRRHV